MPGITFNTQRHKKKITTGPIPVASPENTALTADGAVSDNTWYGNAHHAACVFESVMAPGSKGYAGPPDKNSRLSLHSSLLRFLFSC